ncbi:o-antigen polymerase [Candidatus Gastranaerophilus sp. (ex Termes propinquus)]|nr:o-antigen polymerase [Candidatus Gastranaerophilus sp. (ex Termes propinquus)]
MLTSVILDFLNAFLANAQKSKLGAFAADSLFCKNIDHILFALLILTIFSTAFLSTGAIALFATLFLCLTVFKLLFKKEECIEMSKLDGAILIFFTVGLIALFGSTLFWASLAGFLKFSLYIAFYFCTFHFLKNNKNKILPFLATVALLVSFESVVGILQNFKGVEQIATWQDTSNLDATEVISRCFGTLKPYNPNLFAGYLLVCAPSLFYFSTANFLDKKYKNALLFLCLLLLSFLALIYTGSRGGYLGLFAFIVVALFGIFTYIKKTIGFKNIKTRFKNLALTLFASAFLFILSSSAISKRVLSIFAFREDSSISFRLNVYEASWRMFLDNFFVGIGLGNQNFREVYGLYMKTTFDALGAYSVPLEVAVEMGIFGLLAFLYFIFLAFKYCIVLLKNPEMTKSKILAMSILLMLTATMVHGLWDTIWYRPNVQIIFWLNIAILNTLIMKPALKSSP